MAINEWKIWIKLGLAKPKKQEPVNIDKDIKAIEIFLNQINSSVKDIQSKIKQFNSLRKQESKLKGNLLRKNIASQIRIYDRVLRSYEFFNMDENITAERIKKITKTLKNKAEKIKIENKLLNKIRTDEKWTFDW